MTDAGIRASRFSCTESAPAPHVDGQLVISHDILGNFVGDIRPSFVKRYGGVGDEIERVFRAYADDVRGARFPGPEHCYAIPREREDEIHELRESVHNLRAASVDGDPVVSPFAPELVIAR